MKMMIRASVAAIAAALLSMPTTVEAFHPFDQTYGYQAPSRGSVARATPKAKSSAKASKKSVAESANSGGSGKPKPAAKPQVVSFDDDGDDAPKPKAKKKKSAENQDSEKPQSAKKGPAVLDGGARPSISPAAPPVVGFGAGHASGSIVIDTSGRKLYYVLGGGKAYRYPISVGREGFTWTGTQPISRKVAWPDWRPPEEMRERQPHLPELMTGGLRNPLGAKALYLGNSLYRIHGTNDLKSIGHASSSGCFRMQNAHVEHLSSIAPVGTTVRVLNSLPKNVAKASLD